MTLTIGELIGLLKDKDPKLPVKFDFAGCVPTDIDSWRGIYAEAALGWRPTGYTFSRFNQGRSLPDPTVASLLHELEKIKGNWYEGWKGGEFQFSTHTPLWVDNPGDYTSTQITGIKADDYAVTLLTAQEGP